MHTHFSAIYTCQNQQTLTDPDKSLTAYVGETHNSRVKILALWAKTDKNGGKKVGCFCKGYSEHVFLCSGTDRHEILAKTSVGVLC